MTTWSFHLQVYFLNSRLRQVLQLVYGCFHVRHLKFGGRGILRNKILVVVKI